MAPRRTTAKRGGDPKVSVSHRIAEGLPVRSLKIAPKSSKELSDVDGYWWPGDPLEEYG